MHYGNNAFAKDRRKATIVAKKGGGATPFGNLHLSPLDIKQANIVYKCPGKTDKTAFSDVKRCLLLSLAANE